MSEVPLYNLRALKNGVCNGHVDALVQREIPFLTTVTLMETTARVSRTYPLCSRESI